MDPSSPEEDKLRTRESLGIGHLALRRAALLEPEIEQRLGQDIGCFATAPTEISEPLFGGLRIIWDCGFGAHGELKTRSASSWWDAHGPNESRRPRDRYRGGKSASPALDD